MTLTKLKSPQFQAWVRQGRERIARLADKAPPFLRLSKERAVLGLDFGYTSVKLSLFSKNKEGFSLVRTDCREFDPENKPDLAVLLRDLLKGIDLAGARVNVSVNSPETVLRVITVPPVPPQELGQALKLESRNYFPFPIDDCILEFKVLEEVVEKGAKKMRVAVGVMPRKVAEEILSLLGPLKIKPVSFLPAAYALYKAVSFIPASAEVREAVRFPDLPENQTCCLLDIGARQTECVILKGRKLVFTRKILVSGRDFTKALTEVLVSDRGRVQLAAGEAEQIKRTTGLPADSGSADLVDGKITTWEIATMLRMPLEQLTSEIDRCFDYYREETGRGKIDSVVLFGRGSLLMGLADALTKTLGVPVRVGGASAHTAVAVGAGFSDGKGLNLLPVELKQELQRTVKRASLQSVGIAAFLLAVFMHIGMTIQLGNYGKRISVAQQQLEGMGPLLQMAKAHNLARRILGKEPYWDDVFKELSHDTPAEIYLTSIGVETQVLTIEGKVFTEDRERILSEFILNLEKGVFNHVKLVTVKELGSKAGSQFQIKSWFD